MAIEDIKRLPTSYESTVLNKGTREIAGKDAGNQRTESMTQAGNINPVSATNESTASQQAIDVNKAIGKLQDYVQNLDRELQFAVDDDTGRTVVTIRDAETQKVLRQIPSEELLALTKSLEHTQGMLFKKEA